MSNNPAILIIDGSPLFRFSAGRMIRNELPELEVLEADRFESALELVKIHRPVVVITEIHLKNGSGLELTEIIATRFPDTIVMVLTINDGPEYKAEALKRGADFFISKTDPGGRTLLDFLRDRASGSGGK
ncbi:response regulator transcription factor [Desulfococcus sp.]|uniref:response regulator n=1 Tax=Desulfococcus sp. TaxID=2025834 RepID=UPI00359383A2